MEKIYDVLNENEDLINSYVREIVTIEDELKIISNYIDGLKRGYFSAFGIGLSFSDIEDAVKKLERKVEQEGMDIFNMFSSFKVALEGIEIELENISVELELIAEAQDEVEEEGLVG